MNCSITKYNLPALAFIALFCVVGLIRFVSSPSHNSIDSLRECTFDEKQGSFFELNNYTLAIQSYYKGSACQDNRQVVLVLYDNNDSAIVSSNQYTSISFLCYPFYETCKIYAFNGNFLVKK